MSSVSITGSKRRARPALKCEFCSTVWNQDVNNVLSIYDIFVYKSKHNSEGSYFTRSSKEQWIQCAVYNGIVFLNA